MVGPGETVAGNGEFPSPEEQVLDIFAVARRVLAEGIEKLGGFQRENPQGDSLRDAVMQLGIEHLAELVVGTPVTDIEEGEASTLKHTAGLWAREEAARQLYRLARPLYIADQNRAIGELLADSRIAATPRPGFGFSAVAGMFKEADVSGAGSLLLVPEVPEVAGDNPDGLLEVQLFAPFSGEQQFDIRIDN